MRKSIPSDNYLLAQQILGKDFISPEDIAKACGIIYTSKQIKQLRAPDSFPTPDAIKRCRNEDCILVAGPPNPLSLLDICILKPNMFWSTGEGWYSLDVQTFSRNDKVESSWIAIGKKAVLHSTGKNWGTHQELRDQSTYVPNVAEVVWGLMTYKMVRDIRLIQKQFVRTSSFVSTSGPASAQVHIIVGHFGPDGLRIPLPLSDGKILGTGVLKSLKI